MADFPFPRFIGGCKSGISHHASLDYHLGSVPSIFSCRSPNSYWIILATQKKGQTSLKNFSVFVGGFFYIPISKKPECVGCEFTHGETCWIGVYCWIHSCGSMQTLHLSSYFSIDSENYPPKKIRMIADINSDYYRNQCSMNY